MACAPSSPVLTTGARLGQRKASDTPLHGHSGFGCGGNQDGKGVLLEVPHVWTGVVQL